MLRKQVTAQRGLLICCQMLNHRLCVCVYKFVFVQMCAHICVYVARDHPLVSFLRAISLAWFCLGTESLTELALVRLALPVNSWDPYVSPVRPPTQCWGHRSLQPYPELSMGAGGSNSGPYAYRETVLSD